MHYAITAKKTRGVISKIHYEDYLGYISDLGSVGNVNYETTRGLHLHFVLLTKDKLDYSKLKPTKYGWNIKAVPIYDMDKWISYIQKDKPLFTERESLLLLLALRRVKVK